MLGAKELNELSKNVYSNPKALLDYDLSGEELSILSRYVYNISLTDSKGKDFLPKLKFNAIAFNEKNALDLETNPLENASNLLWFGHTGKEGIYDIVKGDSLNMTPKIDINSIIGKKNINNKIVANKVSSVSDLIKDAYSKANMANNQDKKSLKKESNGKIL